MRENRIRGKLCQEQTNDVPRGVLRGLCGMYAGAEIMLTEGAVVLGRDAARVNLVFDEMNPRVSRKHCKISYDRQNQVFILEDYSSTGTYKNGSTNCLPQGMSVTLQAGSVIAIGDETNQFILE